MSKKNTDENTEITETAVVRLGSLEPELRATLILKDVIGLLDEEVSEILGLRWGIYRHRLNRGRVDWCQILKGLDRKAELQ
jgi:DNA-directed RNA polymerase specialized sigma24 family protein